MADVGIIDREAENRGDAETINMGESSDVVQQPEEQACKISEAVHGEDRSSGGKRQ